MKKVSLLLGMILSIGMASAQTQTETIKINGKTNHVCPVKAPQEGVPQKTISTEKKKLPTKKMVTVKPVENSGTNKEEAKFTPVRIVRSKTSATIQEKK